MTEIIDPIGVGLAESDAAEYQQLRVDRGYPALVADLTATQQAELKASQTTGYVYDEVGNRTSKTKADSTVLTYSYDELDRLSAISTPGLSIAYAYDEVGNRATMTDPTGVTSYIYDELYRQQYSHFRELARRQSAYQSHRCRTTAATPQDTPE